MKALWISILLLACFRASPPRLEPLVPRAECGQLYADHLQQAQRFEEQSEFRYAAEAYSALLTASCFEVPNYEATLHLARALCAVGDIRQGREAIEDFQCMLEVESGNLDCYVSGEAFVPNPCLSSRCFEAMCGELYLPYYESPTSQQLTWVSARQGEAAQVLSYCTSRQ